MPPPRAAAALAALVALAALGCGTPCQDLASRICGCQPAGAARDACNNEVSNLLGGASPTAADQTRCQTLLASCKDPSEDTGMCDRLNTCQGKVDCGLAYDCPPPPSP